MISLADVIAKNSTTPQSPQNSLQLLVNKFAYRYDTNLRDYVETTLLRLFSGAARPLPPSV